VTAAERIRFATGALLAAADLRDEHGARAAARASHVRGVHDTWGVALGYAVGAAGHWVVVGPGVAYDCHGAELVLARAVALQPPEPEDGAAGAWFTLVTRRLGDDEVRGDDTLCARGGRERPRFAWVPRGRPLPPGEAVPIAGVRVGSAGVDEVSLAERRAAHPAAGARLAAGSATVRVEPEEALYSTHAVDTSAARFREEPLYFAALAGEPLEQASAAGPFLAIADPGPEGFLLRVRFAQHAPSEPAGDRLLAIRWVGVEPIRGCWPPVDVGAALAGAGAPLSRLATYTQQPALGQMVRTLEEA
jgi:hypothetical protein